jgi:very-short-patch-repair endonuclease
VPARPTPLPERFLRAPAFATADAEAAGVPRNRLEGRDLIRPFAGVRATVEPADAAALARAYGLKMSEHEFFSHGTAAVLHGMWLPFRLQRPGPIHVSVFPPHRAPRDRGVIGHHLQDRGQGIVLVAGLSVLEPVETWCQLGSMLRVEELVAAADSLLTPAVLRPEAALAALVRAAAVPGRRGSTALRAALELVRPGVRSAQETALRLMVMREGLPEPAVNQRIYDPSGRFVAEGDLVYPDHRVLLEYEGDYHRTDLRQFRKDIHRRERLVELDWWVIRITSDDLALRPEETVARIAATLRRRSPR